MKFEGSQHIVSRFQVSANYDEVDAVKETQEVVSRIIKYKFPEILERYCDCVDKEKWIKISSINLNLGAIPREKIAEKLPQIFERKLDTIFSGLRNNNYHIDGLGEVDVVDAEMRIIEGVVYFMKYGNIPWFLQELIGTRSIQEVFTKLIESNHSVLEEQLTEVMNSTNGKRRLVNLLGDNELKVLTSWGKAGIVAQRAVAVQSVLQEAIQRISSADNAGKSYLETYVKEFFLEVIIRDGKSRGDQSVEDLVHDCMQFLEQKKQIEPSKWIPQVIASIMKSSVKRPLADKVIPGVKRYYIDYLTGTKVKSTLQPDFYRIENAIREETAKQLSAKQKHDLQNRFFQIIQQLTAKIESVYQLADYSQIESVVSAVAAEVLNNRGSDISKIEEIEAAITKEVSHYFGNEIVTHPGHQADLSGKHEEAYSEEKYLEEESEETKGEVPFEKESKTFSIAGSYWRLFLLSSVQPFRKLYAEPDAELSKIFREFIKTDADSALQAVEEYVGMSNVFIVGWWIQYHLGEEILNFYKQAVKRILDIEIPEKIRYEYALMTGFFSTGFFPWPEIAQNGKEKLQETIVKYFSEEHREELVSWLKTSEFFMRELIISRVFKTLPVQQCKQLMQIRQTFLQNGWLNEKDIASHYLDAESEMKNEDSSPHSKRDEQEPENQDDKGYGASKTATEKTLKEEPQFKPDKQGFDTEEEQSGDVSSSDINPKQEDDKPRDINSGEQKFSETFSESDENSLTPKNADTTEEPSEKEEVAQGEEPGDQPDRKAETVDGVGAADLEEVSPGNDERKDSGRDEQKTKGDTQTDQTAESISQKQEALKADKAQNMPAETDEKEKALKSSRHAGESDEKEQATTVSKSTKEEDARTNEIAEKESKSSDDVSLLKNQEDEAHEASLVKDIPDAHLIDHIAAQILDFHDERYPTSQERKRVADNIFRLIAKSAKNHYYETAAMLAAIPHKKINPLLEQFNSQQLDYVRKMVKAYQLKFVSLAEEIKEAEEAAKRKYESLDLGSGEPVFVQNAGLVLLNPYLKRLFSRFDLLEGKEFKSDEAKEKAVYLLQYLANKNEEPEEFELTLNKILCGIPLGVPIKNPVELTDEEKEVCNGLLTALVQNWKTLKNTSADGLRTSFLMREGSLKREANGWKLVVEKKVYDILLEKLPWGYSMIHFPWMEFPLYTEWEGN